MYKYLYNFDTDSANIDEMIGLSAFGANMKAEYARHNLEVPVWLEDKLGQITRAIDAGVRDERERQLKAAELELDSMKSRLERKSEVEAKRARLRAQLGK